MPLCLMRGYIIYRTMLSSSNERSEANSAMAGEANGIEPAKAIRTKTDSKLDSTKLLYEASNRLSNVASESKSSAAVLEDKDASQRKHDETARNIKKIMIPVISKVSSILNDSAKSTAPIGSVKVICDRLECKKKQEIIDNGNKRKSADVQLLKSYVSMPSHAAQVQDNITRPCRCIALH